MALSKIDTGGLAADAVDNTILDLAGDYAGMHFGGTGSSNQLDDYEEGTFTGTISGSTTNPTTAVTQTCHYTKVGSLVFASVLFTNVDTTGAAGGVRIDGMPFTANITTATGNCMFHTRIAMSTSASNIAVYIANNTQLAFYQSLNTSGWQEVSHSAGTGAYIWASVVYTTDS